MISQVENIDNMLFMEKFPDKFFDLAIVDPPYGISVNMNMGRKKGEKKRYATKKWDDDVPPPVILKNCLE